MSAGPFLELLVKITALLGVPWVGLAVCRRGSPATRHAILVWTLASALLLPVTTNLTPELVVLAPAWVSDSDASVSRVNEPPVAATVSPLQVMGHTADPPLWRSTALWVVVFWIWALGVALLCLRLTVGTIALRRLSRSAVPLTDESWSGLLRQLAGGRRVRRPIRLLASASVDVPLTWGWLDPVVVLPADALAWTHQPREMTLRHEIAHVNRGDFLSNLVAEAACIVYWFHPLSWWTKRALRYEQERACDDAVLAGGVDPAAYATLLIEWTDGLSDRQSLTMAIADATDLESRVVSITSSASRRPPRTTTLCLIAAIMMGVSGLLSALVLAPKDVASDANNPLAKTTLQLRSAGSSQREPGPATAQPPSESSRSSNEPHLKLQKVGVTPAYVAELEKAGYGQLSQGELIKLRKLEINAMVVRRVTAVTGSRPSVRDLIRLKKKAFANR
jgi:beta-lactamase regulating signal transducer with metallopeptidase domain